MKSLLNPLSKCHLNSQGRGIVLKPEFKQLLCVIAGGAGGQQEGLQYNGEAAW
jgi:hypothetical protein